MGEARVRFYKKFNKSINVDFVGLKNLKLTEVGVCFIIDKLGYRE